MEQALDRPNVGMRGKLFEGYAPQFLCLFSLMLTHFLIAAHFTSRTIQDLLPLKFFGEVMVLGTLPVLALILLCAIKITVRQIDKPTITLVRLVYSNRSWILRSLLLFAIMLPTAQAFVALKVAIPSIVPFYADPYLAALDRMLFLGIDPWRFTHAIFGLPATVVIDWVYASWGGVATAVMLWAAFDRDPQFQIKAAFSLFLTWAVLGNALAIALSSVGPIFYYDFYGATTFAPLMEMLPCSQQGSMPSKLITSRVRKPQASQQKHGSPIRVTPLKQIWTVLQRSSMTTKVEYPALSQTTSPT